MVTPLWMRGKTQVYEDVSEKGEEERNGLGYSSRGKYLSILELDQVSIVYDNLVPFISTLGEQLRQREPLPSHLIPIVGVHKLIIVDAVGGRALHALHGGMAAVEGDDVVEKALAGRGEGKGFAGIGGIIF